MDAAQKLLGDNPTIWVFGYGSLLWKPDFRYKSKKIGYIKDYERRFYQGNVTFRGKPGQPGRVANLEEKKGSQVWGVAYEISGREEVTQVLQALYTRETTSGGYVTMVTSFYPRDEQNHKPINRTSKSNVNRHEFSMPDSRAYHELSFSIHSEHISSLQRMDSSISDESIYNKSSDHIYETTSTSLTYSQLDSALDNIVDDSLKAQNEHVDNLIFNQNGFVNDNKTMRESHNFVEHSYNQSLSSSHEHLKPQNPIKDNTEDNLPSLPVLLYTATPDNDLYLGPDDVSSMARQIVSANGSAGSNVEYVTKIADYVRKYIPEDEDSHLFSLDSKIREEIYRRQSVDSTRLQLGFADLNYDLHDLDHEIIVEPVMAS